MSNPPITVLMTVYNGGKYLSRSVKSVLGQTFTDFEFLIVDDASTDDSVKTIEAFQDKRIVICPNEVNVGQTKSLNKGLALAKAPYVARLDADDLAAPQWLEEQLAFIREKSSYAVVSAQALIIDKNDKLKRPLFVPQEYDEIRLRSLIRTPINHVGSVMKKEAVLACGGYDERFKLAADYSLWSRLLRGGEKITANPKVLVVIRDHDSSLSALDRGSLDILEIGQIMAENIACFSASDFPRASVDHLCQAFLAEHLLSSDQFFQALATLEKVVHATSDALSLNKGTVERWLTETQKTLYTKRVYALTQSNQYALARETAQKGAQQFGLGHILFWVYLCFFLGTVGLKSVPRLYRFYAGWRARWMLFRLSKKSFV